MPKFPSCNIDAARRRMAGCLQNAHGFTLIELVVVIIILGILAAVALPRFINMGTNARIATVKAGLGAVTTAATLANIKCRLSAACTDFNYQYGLVDGPGGASNYMYFGYPTGLSRPNAYYGIKEWVQMDGFDVVEVSGSVTEFRVPGAPDANNCKVTYTVVSPYSPGTFPPITATISSC